MAHSRDLLASPFTPEGRSWRHERATKCARRGIKHFAKYNQGPSSRGKKTISKDMEGNQYASKEERTMKEDKSEEVLPTGEKEGERGLDR